VALLMKEGGPIQWLLFENRIALIVALGLVEFALLWIWARYRTRGARRAAWAGLVIGGLLLLMQTWVVTDREHLIRICREMATAVEEGDVDGVGRHVAKEFASGALNRGDLLDGLGRLLERLRIEEPWLWDFEVEVSRPDGSVSFHALCRIVTADLIEGGQKSRWRLAFRRVGDQWRVVDITPIPTTTFRFRSLDEILRGW
jgi:hypothetical protein